MPDKSYPEGVTSLDHMKHDVRVGRFPNVSSVETFLKERAVLAAQEDVAHLTGGPSPRDGELAALSAGASKGEWLLDVQTYYDEDGGPSEEHTEGVMVLDNDEQPDSIVQCSEANAKFIVALVNTYRSGKLKEV